MMSSQEQYMNQSKQIKIEFTFSLDSNMTPNILTPRLCDAFKALGVSDFYGKVYNILECSNEVNAVVVSSK